MISLRGLAGVLIGVVYGLLVGVVVFLLTRIGLDTENPGPLIMIDPVGMAWLATVMSALITGVCATLLGLIVALAGVRKTKAATIGFIRQSLAGPFSNATLMTRECRTTKGFAFSLGLYLLVVGTTY